MNRYFVYWLRRMSHPFRGIKSAILHDDAFQIEIGLGLIGIPLLYVFFGPFSLVEGCIIVGAWLFTLHAELHNSALELALDKLHPEHNELIGRSKDMASASVVLAACVGLVGVAFVVFQ